MHIDHLSIYVRDVERSRHFYESVLLPYGWQVVRDFGELAVGFGHGNYAEFAVVREKGAINSAHVAFGLDKRSEVDELYSIAIDAGATDHGLPGMRPQYHKDYYAGFVIDPDGHNIEFVCHNADA